MTFTQSVKSVFSQYDNFSGRASRSEYWYFQLFNFLISVAICAIACVQIPFSSISFHDPGQYYVAVVQSIPGWASTLMTLYSIGIFIPSLAVAFRRLHDTAHGGGWIFINLVPFIGSIWFFILMILPGAPGVNRFGQRPY